MPRLYALVLSGGAGTRLWPRSRQGRPKQFLDLVGPRTMLQDTVERVSDLIPMERIFVVAPPEHRALIHEQLPDLRADHVVVEPYPRGNAAAIGLAMAALHAFDPDAVVAVLASDHVVTNRDSYRRVLIAAATAADAGYLVTIGINPTKPETGFGYIEAGEPIALETPVPVLTVRRFVEKPPRPEAERMLAAGGHYWNASMFVWRVDRILADFRRFLPATADALDSLASAIGTERYEHVLADAWERTDRTTIDYGIAEKADKVAVVPADIGWEDVGSWARLAEIVTTAENWVAGDHVAEGSSGNYVWAPGKTVALIGVDNLIVVDTADALLIATKERSEEVKTIVDRLRRDDRGELL